MICGILLGIEAGGAPIVPRHDAVAQSGDSVSEEWVQRYNGPGNYHDEARSVAVDASGNVYVTGTSARSSGYSYDYATIKYAPDGSQQWVERYGYGGAYALALDPDGNVYVTGQSWVSGPDDEYATIKYAPDGSQQWVQTYNPDNAQDGARSIAVDASGNVYVTGNAAGAYATVKYATDGSQQWVQTYNGPANSSASAASVAVDASGNVYVTGTADVSGADCDYATIKYAPDGSQQWVQTYNGPANLQDVARSIAVDAAGNVYVTGESMGFPSDTDYATIKYAFDGSQQWVQRYNGPASAQDSAYSLAVDASGNVYVTGASVGSSSTLDYATIKYAPDGTQRWVQRHEEPYSGGTAYSLAVDASGNVYVTGGYSVSSLGQSDYVTIKYAPDGSQQWVQTYNGPDNQRDWASSIAVDASGNVYVTGQSWVSGTAADYATIKYSQAAGPSPTPTVTPPPLTATVTPTPTPAVTPPPPPVGGIAEHPQLEPGAATSAYGSSGPSTLAVAGLVAATALLLSVGGWYARKRFS